MVRRLKVLALAGAMGAALVGSAGGTQVAASVPVLYTVLAAEDSDAAAVEAAVTAAGGVITARAAEIGVYTARADDAAFAATVSSGAGTVIETAVPVRAIGSAAAQAAEAPAVPAPAVPAPSAPALGPPHLAPPAVSAEPLAARQWNMAMIDADAGGSHAVLLGRKGVVVAVVDTGIDATHPDLAGQVDLARSRNFTTDDPLIDGACTEEADGSCSDGVDVDDNGHGTHVAGIIAASLDGAGIGGVAPGVTLVNVRAGQDSGSFFLQPAVDALLYSAEIGVDVVNMSFFVDPWLYNCPANPADSPEEQAQQRTTIEALQRAVDAARAKGVTVVGALGNEHADLDRPTLDRSSPNYPPGASRTRTVDNSCLDVPAELDGVLAVGAVGPSTRKADYANYSLAHTDLAAPGGWLRDGLGTPSYYAWENLVLSTWPTAVAEAEIAGADGVVPRDLVRTCGADRCAYHKYLQGTSMAAPHVSGVAALIVSRFGRPSPDAVLSNDLAGDQLSRDQLIRDQLTLEPQEVERILDATAHAIPCPPGGGETYAAEGRTSLWTAVCEVSPDATRNSFYGRGIVNALAAATATVQTTGVTPSS